MNFYFSSGLFTIITLCYFSKFQILLAQDATLTTSVRIQNIATEQFLAIATANLSETSEWNWVASNNNWKVNWGKGNRDGTRIEGQIPKTTTVKYLAPFNTTAGGPVIPLDGAEQVWVFQPVYNPSDFTNYYLIKMASPYSTLCMEWDNATVAGMKIDTCRPTNSVPIAQLYPQLFRFIM